MLAAVAPTVRASAEMIHVAAAPGAFSAGVAKVEMTPPVGMPLAGYSRRAGMPSTGVHDPLYARAVAVSDGRDLAFIVAADLLVIPPGFTVEVAQHLSDQLHTTVLPESILLCATHTHSGPGGYLPGLLGRFAGGAYRRDQHARLIEACAAAAAQAAQDLRPAKLGVARTARPELVENRVQAGGPVDPQVTVLAIDDLDGHPIATLLNFAAHPTLLSSKNRLFSADFPGAACRELEARRPGSIALFTNGAAADLRPQHVRGLDNFALADAIGASLADAAMEALAGARWSERVEVAAWGGLFQLPPPRLPIGPITAPPWLTRRLVQDQARFNVIALNDIILISAPADLASTIGLRVKQQLAARGLTAIIVGFADDYAGYIVPAELFATNAYEAKMGWHGPMMELVYESIVENLVGEYLARALTTGALSDRARGLPVVILRGDPYAMGYEQGSRYRAQVQGSVANIMSFIESKAPPIPFRGAFVRWRLSAYYAKMAPFIPQVYREELRGLADGSGVPLAELQRIHALPEIASVWCTSSVAFGHATTDGRLLHLRNLDWAIHSDLQRYAALFVCHPTGGHAFVNLGYFGFLGVLSGISDVGISVSEIGATTIDQTVRGMPMPFLLRQVLEVSDDLPRAVQLVREAPRTAGFHYVFADAIRRQAVALETTKSHCAVFWAGDREALGVPYALPTPEVTVRADPALDPAVRDLQRCSKGDPSKPGLEPPAGAAYDVRYRAHTLLLQEQYGHLDPAAMMQVARAVAPPSNVQSIVFAFPELWVATARGASPAAQQPYGHYDLSSLFAQDDASANPKTTPAS